MKTYPQDKKWLKARQGGINAITYKRRYWLFGPKYTLKEAEKKWDWLYQNRDICSMVSWPLTNAAVWRAFEIEDRENRIEEIKEGVLRAK